MTVYIIQQPKPNNKGWMPDLSSAMAYGKIEFIFDVSEKVYALPTPSLLKARRLFRDKFDYAEDYLLWTNSGDPMAFMITSIACAELGFPYIKVLYWNRKRNSDGERQTNEGFYFPLKINLKERKDNEEYGFADETN